MESVIWDIFRKAKLRIKNEFINIYVGKKLSKFYMGKVLIIFLEAILVFCKDDNGLSNE